jgi:hypothetical protein
MHRVSDISLSMRTPFNTMELLLYSSTRYLAFLIA